jgi:dihydrofolate synthase/folylpolyglutamate synthase
MDIRERIQLSGVPISAKEFAALVTRCAPVLEEMRVRPPGERRLTYFEALTHLAFLRFAEQHVDAAVVEVGMGGRLDATNLVRPCVCGVTNLSLDHTHILGATLPEIAREKAGIFKPGVPIVSAPQAPEAAAVLADVAAQCASRLEFIGRELALEVTQPPGPQDGALLPRSRAKLRAPDGWHAEAELGLPGAFQAENWAVAARLCSLAFEKIAGAPLPEAAVRAGSGQVRWPGRLEEIPVSNGGPHLVLDGAHNDYSVQVVLSELGAVRLRRGPLVVLFGCAKDKDAPAMLRHVARLADGVVFAASASPRSRPPTELAALWRELTGRAAPAETDLGAALASARQAAQPRGVVLATGSLYLVGALKNHLARAGKGRGKRRGTGTGVRVPG